LLLLEAGSYSCRRRREASSSSGASAGASRRRIRVGRAHGGQVEAIRAPAESVGQAPAVIRPSRVQGTRQRVVHAVNEWPHPLVLVSTRHPGKTVLRGKDREGRDHERGGGDCTRNPAGEGAWH